MACVKEVPPYVVMRSWPSKVAEGVPREGILNVSEGRALEHACRGVVGERETPHSDEVAVEVPGACDGEAVGPWA